MDLQATGTSSDVDTGDLTPIPPFRRLTESGLPARSHGLTDTGYERTHNEDCFRLDDSHKLYVVADGVGGASHGDLASRIAVDSIHGAYSRTSDGVDLLFDRLEDAIGAANGDLCDVVEDNVAVSTMGTTVVALALDDDMGTVAHLGDSRAYLLRDRKLELLTQDHTVAAEYVARGWLNEREAASHPLSHVLTRVLPSTAELEIDLLTLRLRPGDVFLLCSDGLTKMMNDDDICACLLEEGGIKRACRRLIGEALDRGGLDNVTVGLVEVLEPQGRPMA